MSLSYVITFPESGTGTVWVTAAELPKPSSSWTVVDGEVTRLGKRHKRPGRVAQRKRMRERIDTTGTTETDARRFR